MENPYIIRGISNDDQDVILTNDASNDHQIIFDLTLQLQSVISTAKYYAKEKALAINPETADYIINELDDILYNIVQPHQDLIDSALDDSRRD